MATTLPIVDAITRHWWTLLIRGILGVLFGIVSFMMPGLTLSALVILYGLYALTDGLMAIWLGAQTRVWWLALFGLLAVAVGVYTFVNPGVTAVALLYVIATVAGIRGVAEIVTAIRLRQVLTNEWMLIASGIASILLGLVLFVYPGPGILAMVWLIGAYALLVGAMLIVLAFKLRGIPQRLQQLTQH